MNRPEPHDHEMGGTDRTDLIVGDDPSADPLVDLPAPKSRGRSLEAGRGADGPAVAVVAVTDGKALSSAGADVTVCQIVGAARARRVSQPVAEGSRQMSTPTC